MNQNSNKDFRLLDLMKQEKALSFKNIRSVEDIMTSDVICLGIDDTIEVAIRIFLERKFRHLPVVDQDRNLVGVVSDRDILMHISPLIGTAIERDIDRATLKRKIHGIMSTKLITAVQDTSIHYAASLMIERKINCLPVVDALGKIKGIVTSADLLRALEAISLSIGS